MIRKIPQRTLIPVLLFTLATFLLLAVVLPHQVESYFLSQLKQHTREQLTLIAPVFQGLDLEDSGAEELSHLTQEYGRQMEGRLQVLSADGHLLADSTTQGPYPDRVYPNLVLQTADEEGFGSAVRQEGAAGNIFSAALPLREGSTRIGYLYFSTSLESIQQKKGSVRRTILVGGGLLAFLNVLVIGMLSLSVTRPLDAMARTSRKIAGGDHQASLEVTPKIEVISDLSRALNHLIHTFRGQISQLQSERATLRSVLTQMTDGVVIADGQGRITLINPAAEQIFQISAEDAEGRTVAEVLRHHQWIELWGSSQQTESAVSTSLEIPSRNIFLQGIAIPLVNNLSDHTLLLFQDLSRLRRLETTRQDFISNISHELRTPLASLKALTETLQDGALDDPPAAKRFLRRIDTEVDALTHMVAELLELSRIESGQVPLELEPVSPHTLLTKASDRMRAQAERRSVSIKLDIPRDLPPVKADYRRVEQVLVNLLHNAIKFSPPDETLVMKAVQVEDEVHFSIQDQGPGIPSSDLDRIFERFYKTDQARASGGTGLGLAIAKHLVGAHGGKIWAESELNQGSTFFFSLPAVEAASPP
mgnify:CR=1 FL=1